jgi:3,4-dihydroxy-2-butanone 4-phosphate synthase
VTQAAFETTSAVRVVEQAIEHFRQGGIVLVFDSESRENEGDMMLAAELTDEQTLGFLLDHTCGVVCVALPGEISDRLELPQMVTPNSGLHDTAFTVSVDISAGASTGISVGDRTRTIRALGSARTQPSELARPGHIFPIRAADGGTLVRDGHTEAAVDLSLLAGLSGATAICEVVRPDWSMARYDDLVALGNEHGLPLISVQDIADYRRHLGAGDPLAGPKATPAG